NRRLGLVFEAKVNGGKLLVCSVDVETDIENRPAARQLRRSLIDYMVSDGFDPEHEVTVEQINGLIKEPSAMQKYGASIKSVDSQANGNEAVMAIDGNASTCWHTEWQGVTPDYPHEIVIEFDEQIKVSGLKYLPRQDMRNGWISEYEVYVSSDGRNWSEPAAAGSFERNAALKTIPFDKQYDCKYLRFVAVKGIDGQKFASVGELEVIIAN
ncbi:MAG: discoidin domain-containing protein, partial [Anaerohalosphaera sp.]|nr:discoidin domain-containing protein [Anaerohalosphaera sp.]